MTSVTTNRNNGDDERIKKHRKTALGKITFVTRFLPSENKVYTYIHTLRNYEHRITTTEKE